MVLHVTIHMKVWTAMNTYITENATETIAPKDTGNAVNSIIAEKDVTESQTVPSCTGTYRW